MLVKTRPPGTIKDALRIIVDALGRENVAQATGFAMSSVYAWTEEDRKLVPNVTAALMMDMAYAARTGAEPPILQLWRRQLEGLSTYHQRIPLTERLMHLTAEVGDVAGAIRAAGNPNSDGGAAITDRERHKIADEIRAVREVLAALERDVLARPAVVAADNAPYLGPISKGELMSALKGAERSPVAVVCPISEAVTHAVGERRDGGSVK